MAERKSIDELRSERNEIMQRRDQTTDPAERARLAAEMRRISDEITDRSLDAGEEELRNVNSLEQSLDKERTSTSTDALSALGRGARGLQDKLGGGGKDGGSR